MKKLVLLFPLSLLIFTQFSFAQKAEVLYFKADLACCQAKACNALENDVKTVVQKLYPGGEVVFKTLRLADPANKPQVDKFNAKSQTVVIVAKTKKGEKTLDITDIVRNYNISKDMAVFEANMKKKFEEILK
ncbi:MAG TPA: hypothetical protein P5050_02260 [Bacteroidia bacterium]|nr:hypothetical protein [Bacteroidia bacterium]HRS58025.1 hypothetical protein [Bacteroidia bacterium]HRU68850.1 hypothetical protein [Bacteroidia bacterium]